MNAAEKQDRADLERLVQTLEQLSRDMAETFEPAAARVGCFLGIAHIGSFRKSLDSGTAYSLIVVLRKCLDGRS